MSKRPDHCDPRRKMGASLSGHHLDRLSVSVLSSSQREVENMARTTKKPEERRLEIIKTAERLFREKGYSNTPVDAIITEMGVAKGTFYYYFKSKEDVLEAIAAHQLQELAQTVKEVADDASLGALAKMRLLLSDSHVGGEGTPEVVEQLHLPANRELHEVTNIQAVLVLSPLFATIVEQGNREGVFNALFPLETMQFLLTGGQFLLDGGLFDFSEQELRERRLAMQAIVERALGAESGSFDFMNPDR
jgi:AcrR family transcriptional regulator